MILADTTIVQPDIVYLESSRRSALVERGVEGPPTLAVEVHVLHGKAYGLVMQASGSEPVDVPPFAGLELVPAELGS